MSELSIIIVNWNTKDLLRDCLQSIYQNSPKGEFDVFVVDNASTDGSLSMIKKEFPQVELIENNKNLGFARANNQGIRESEGKYVLLLNSDTVVKKNSLNNLVDFMKNRDNVGVAGPRILKPNGNVEESCGFFPSPWAVFLTKLNRKINFLGRFKSLKASHLALAEEKEVDWVAGACMLVRRKSFEKAGLLDEKIFMYFEDVDWCCRIKKAGWKICFTPSAEIVHISGASVKKLKKPIKPEYRKNQYYIYQKHLNKASLFFLGAMIALESFFYRHRSNINE